MGNGKGKGGEEWGEGRGREGNREAVDIWAQATGRSVELGTFATPTHPAKVGTRVQWYGRPGLGQGRKTLTGDVAKDLEAGKGRNEILVSAPGL